jgi:hypothetical protein
MEGYVRPEFFDERKRNFKATPRQAEKIAR